MGWSDLLDGIATKSDEPPPVVTSLRLPGIDGWEPGRAWVDWEVDPDMLNDVGTVFGGYLAVLADSLGGLAFMSTLDDSESFTTADLSVAFFRPLRGGRVRIEGSVVNRGRRMGHVDVTFMDGTGKLLARASLTQVVVPAMG